MYDSDAFLNMQIASDVYLVIDELSDDKIKEEEIPESVSSARLYLYIEDRTRIDGVQILAAIPDEERALALAEVLQSRRLAIGIMELV